MCDICCGNLTKPIHCKLCDFVACYKCFSKFMLECTLTPKCMKCEKPWTRKHLVDSFGQYFVSSTYKKKRENVLFDIEKAMLPDTQEIAARVRKIHEIENVIRIHDNEILELKRSLSRLDPGILDSEFEEFLITRKNYRMQIHDLKEEIVNLYTRKDRLMRRNFRSEKKAPSSFIKCPGEQCRGYVSQSTMICDICETKLCKECHEALDKGTPLDKSADLDKADALDGGHTCNPDTVETVKLIAKDSRNCPSCKTLIHKIDGCDQMFCTQCQTAFSWKTGEVSTGRIHNPHYYEYLRQTGGIARELGDIPCGGLPPATREILGNRLYSVIHQRVSHIEFDEINRLRTDIHRENNQDLRIQYLNNYIDLETFKREIYRREKKQEKQREILTILTTFVTVCSDIFRSSVINGADDAKGDAQVQFETIRKFTNDTLIDVSRVYKCVVPFIDYEWGYTRMRYDRIRV